MKRPQIIEKLKELNVEFEETLSKKELEDILQKAEQGVPQEEARLASEPEKETKVESVEEKPEKDNNDNSKYGAGKVFIPANL